MKVLILAAGYATRLYPLTKEFPKPLLKVGNKPIIDYIVESFGALNYIDEILVVTNSKFIAYFKKWRNKQVFKKRITLIDDLTKSLKDKRGAIGDMYFAIDKKKIKDDLLVIGGDNLLEASPDVFLSFVKNKKHHPVIGIYKVRNKTEAKNYGIVTLNNEKKITGFKEKPACPASLFAAMCLYYFPKDKLRLLEEYLSNYGDGHDATGFYIDWLRKKVPVYGFIFKERWYDIGDRKFYNEAKLKFCKK